MRRWGDERRLLARLDGRKEGDEADARLEELGELYEPEGFRAWSDAVRAHGCGSDAERHRRVLLVRRASP